MRKHLLISCAILLLSFSCKGKIQTVLVYSDLPEAALLLNQFNNSQSEYTAEILFTDTIRTREDSPRGDLLLARDIHSTDYFLKMKNLNSLRGTSYIEGVYPEVLLSCIYEKELRMIPLSLDIPLIISAKENLQTNSKIINWEELTGSSAQFNQRTDGTLNRIGFSPLWSHNFLTNFLASGSTSFQTLLEQPEQEYTNKTAQLSQWISQNNGGAESINRFSSQYMYIPDYRLLIDHRIGFAMMRMSEFMILPDEISRELSFRLYSMEKRIQPLQIISSGIFTDAPNPEGADALMQWLLEKETWKDYYSEILQEKDGIFGLDGLSANYEFNESLLMEAYPAIKGRIPYPGEFERITMPVLQWNRVREEVLIPYTIEVLSEGTSTLSLAERYRKWLLLNPDPLSE